MATLLCIPKARAQTGVGPENLCYAFSRNGDVYLACDGKKVRLTVEGDVADFAVAQDGSQFVLSREIFSKEGYGTGRRMRETYPLETGGRHPTLARGGSEVLYASCGTVLAFGAGWPPPETDFGQGQALDVKTGEALSFHPYTDFRCSSDRRIIVGTMHADRRLLRAGLPPGREVATAEGPQEMGYDVSPNGKFIAYDLVLERKVCVGEGSATVDCLSGVDPDFDMPSVSDAAGVFFTTPADKCRKGQCFDVAYWRVGDNALRRLELRAYHPQWLTPEAASALLAWHSGEAASSKSHPRP